MSNKLEQLEFKLEKMGFRNMQEKLENHFYLHYNSLLDYWMKTGNSGYSVCTPVIAFRDARVRASVTHKHTLLACI